MLGSPVDSDIKLACSDGRAALWRAPSGAFEYRERLQTHANNYLKICAQPREQSKFMCVPASLSPTLSWSAPRLSQLCGNARFSLSLEFPRCGLAFPCLRISQGLSGAQWNWQLTAVELAAATGGVFRTTGAH